MISVVTGGCGFIGSHMVDRLLAEGHTVRVIDNWTTGRPENLEHQRENGNLTVYHKDIRNREEIEPVFQDADYVFHFAALADIVPSIQKPWEYYSSNVSVPITWWNVQKMRGLRSWFMRHLPPVTESRTSTPQRKPQKSDPSTHMR